MSDLRIKQMEMDRTRDHLAQHPHLQAEAVAQHYVAYAHLALYMLTLCRAGRHVESEGKGCDVAIAYTLDQIKAAHRRDLGIELEWKHDETQT